MVHHVSQELFMAPDTPERVTGGILAWQQHLYEAVFHYSVFQLEKS